MFCMRCEVSIFYMMNYPVLETSIYMYVLVVLPVWLDVNAVLDA